MEKIADKVCTKDGGEEIASDEDDNEAIERQRCEVIRIPAFKANFNEKLSMSMQMAVVIGMAPAEIQDIIFQQWKGKGGEVELEKDWKLVRDKIMALVANRVR